MFYLIDQAFLVLCINDAGQGSLPESLAKKKKKDYLLITLHLVWRTRMIMYIVTKDTVDCFCFICVYKILQDPLLWSCKIVARHVFSSQNIILAVKHRKANYLFIHLLNSYILSVC